MQLSLASADLPLEETFTWGGCTLQGHLSCLTQRTENRLPDIVTEVRGRAALPAYVVIYFFSLLPCVAQREWDMFDSILIIFFLYFKSQMLRQFTLIKLQLALKLSCINFSSIYREQDRWFKLHAIWGNARDICYRVNCLKLRFLSPFWVKDVCSHAYWIRRKGFLLKWSMYRFLPLLLFGGAPACCCCRQVHFCELQIAVCRSVTSFAEAAPNVLLGKGCE